MPIEVARTVLARPAGQDIVGVENVEAALARAGEQTTGHAQLRGGEVGILPDERIVLGHNQYGSIGDTLQLLKPPGQPARDLLAFARGMHADVVADPVVEKVEAA